ncbi:MAG: hypothetical protein KGJ97_04440 [Xanthomonadaceae bacterium]|nr:hypothetical protein [Xanthomonadaceae bacterium]
MPIRIVLVVSCLAALLASAVGAQSFSPAVIVMFRALNRQPNALARYVYLTNLLPRLSASDRAIALQMLSSSEDELGLYNEAIRDFPLKNRLPAGSALPKPAEWKSAAAVDVIAKLAAHRRIVMVNEAHHDAHTRQLTLALLPRLRKLGFNYFAAEALRDQDPGLMRRGYPTRASGTIYLHEPTYGEIVREAIRLGYKIVPYDVAEGTTQQREAGQAENLYRRVFAGHPDARLFVHAGYAHIDKAQGQLGTVRPMAMQLQKLTGIEPLSIDQTGFLEQIPAEPDGYRELVGDFDPKVPIVLLNRATGKPWSANPDLYDISVVLPPAAGKGAIDSGVVQRLAFVNDTMRSQPMLTPYVDTQRPDWLAQQEGRFPVRISTRLCKVVVPCVVDAHDIDEPDDAIAIDRYAFMHDHVASKLYLPPGRYRLRAWDIHGKTLSEQVIRVRPR